METMLKIVGDYYEMELDIARSSGQLQIQETPGLSCDLSVGLIIKEQPDNKYPLNKTCSGCLFFSFKSEIPSLSHWSLDLFPFWKSWQDAKQYHIVVIHYIVWVFFDFQPHSRLEACPYKGMLIGHGMQFVLRWAVNAANSSRDAHIRKCHLSREAGESCCLCAP